MTRSAPPPFAPTPKGFAVSTVATEKVLVVPTSLFHELGYFQGFSTEVSKYLPRLLEGDQIQYLPRGRMEEDPSFKQLIPYVLFRWTADDGTIQIFEYQRGGGMGEARLHAKRSVGVGGHISSDDVETSSSAHPSTARKGGAANAPSQTTHAHHVYREGMLRELEEEVAIDTPYDETVVGLINDDETPVGRVHLGIVHLCDVAIPAVEPREADILSAGFRPVRDILTRLDQFETWSQIAVRALFA
jgi:predicted NUDIX family phosphoesterase